MNITKVFIQASGAEIRAIKTNFAASISISKHGEEIKSSKLSDIEINKSKQGIHVSQGQRSWILYKDRVVARHRDKFITVELTSVQRRELLNVLDEVINW